MESMESIRGEQPAINHRRIRRAEHAFMYQTAGHNKRMGECISVSECDRWRETWAGPCVCVRHTGNDAAFLHDEV